MGWRVCGRYIGMVLGVGFAHIRGVLDEDGKGMGLARDQAGTP